MAETAMPRGVGGVALCREPHWESDIRARLRSVCAYLLFAVCLVVACTVHAAGKPDSAAVHEDRARVPSYFMTTSQLPDPLKPFAHLPKGANINVRAAVVTMPDVLETRLGRAFDVEIGAMMSAFQASGYTLDGFAFTWTPREPGSDGEYPSPTSDTRGSPSLMLFRRDDWRNCGEDTPVTKCGSSYYALFLVGETPTSGVHPEAFKRAAACAMALDGSNRRPSLRFPSIINEENCDTFVAQGNAASLLNCERRLDVIGPSFSGSMESMAAALSEVAAKTAGAQCGDPSAQETVRRLEIRLLSPSASISSNDEVRYHAYVKAQDSGKFHVNLYYQSLAYSVSDQMNNVMSYLEHQLGRQGNVVVLSEESSFGAGARQYATSRLGDENAICAQGAAAASQGSGDCWGRLINVQFPPNISAIRAEHVKIKQDEAAQRRQILPGKLLELDLAGVDKGVDQPPAYQPSLSSRSDELLLYQTFDTLKKSMPPAAVIIVATDIRDRLFLLSEIRDLLPGALPIVLEQDNLLEHPDYRDVSRGSITMPAGRSLVCLNSYNDPMPCPPDGARRPPLVIQTGDAKDHLACPSYPRSFAFATDYAANMFRAMVRLAKQNGLTDLEADVAMPLPAKPGTYLAPGEDWMSPHLLVATMAGFQYVEKPKTASLVATFEHDGKQITCQVPVPKKQDILIAADTRLLMQKPVYLALALVFAGILVVSLWLRRNGGERALLIFPIRRYALRMMCLPSDATSPSSGEARSGAVLAWVAMALTGFCISVIKAIASVLPRSNADTDLAHGQAVWVLVALSLGYGCFIVLAMFRMREWNDHCTQLSKYFRNDMPLGMRLRYHGERYAAAAVIATLLALGLCVGDLDPVIVGNAWVSELAGAFMLCGSVFFLTLYSEAYDRLCRISMEFDRVVPLIRGNSVWTDWPTPCLLRERPVSPFNITMRLTNYLAWKRCPTGEWAKYAQQLLDGQWCFGPSSDISLEVWQASLVAEMKFAVTAMRTCAWCAVMGATLAMLLIQVYPSAYPRLQATAGVVLLVLGFAGVVYVVLKLEKDRFLGPMFTNGKDSLTFGGALSALWPKLLVLASILVMALVPSVWDWVGGLIKAVNSLH